MYENKEDGGNREKIFAFVKMSGQPWDWARNALMTLRSYAISSELQRANISAKARCIWPPV